MNNFYCRCGEIIEPPEVSPPQIFSENGVKFEAQVVTKYGCPNPECKRKFTSTFNFIVEVKIGDK